MAGDGKMRKVEEMGGVMGKTGQAAISFLLSKVLTAVLFLSSSTHQFPELLCPPLAF